MSRPLAVLLLAATLAACGQTGPLYYDEAPPADQLPPSRKAPPVSVEQPAAPVVPAPDEEEAKK